MPAFTIEFDREEDGRRIAAIPGALAYGQTREEAAARVMELEHGILADNLLNEGLPLGG